MALRIWAVSAAWVFIPGCYACPGWEWVPSIAIAWGHMLAACLIDVFTEFHGGYFRLQREEYKHNDGKGECARAYISERIYMLIFSLELPTSGLAFPQHPWGPLSRHPTTRVGMWAWYIFVQARVRTWISTTHTDLPLRDTPNLVVPLVH